MVRCCGRVVWSAAAGEHVQVTPPTNLDVVVPQHRLQLVLPRSALVAAAPLDGAGAEALIIEHHNVRPPLDHRRRPLVERSGAMSTKRIGAEHGRDRWSPHAPIELCPFAPHEHRSNLVTRIKRFRSSATSRTIWFVPRTIPAWALVMPTLAVSSAAYPIVKTTKANASRSAAGRRRRPGNTIVSHSAAKMASGAHSR